MAISALIHASPSHQSVPLVKGLPLIGCIPQVANTPLTFFRDLALQHPDIVTFRFGTEEIALVTSASLTHQILVKEVNRFRKADREISILGAFLGNGLVTNQDVANHKMHRKLVQPGFHFRRIQGYAQTMTDYSQRYLNEWEHGQTRDIADDMFKLTMYIVSKTLFDTNMEDMEDGAESIGHCVEKLQNIANKRFSVPFQIPEWIPTPSNREATRVKRTLDNIMRDMIKARTQADGSMEDGDDLMSMLLHARYEDGSRMSERQIMDELITLFIAGHETTSNALMWTFYLLAKHPEAQQRLYEELDTVLQGRAPQLEDLENLPYTDMVIKESMRVLPPAWTLSARQANEDIELDGYLIPKNQTVFISPYAHHHNPRHFKNPEVFDPERFSKENEKALPRFAYMPFGAGPRVCIGNSFAMMEARLILASIASQFHLTLAPEQTFSPEPRITLSNKGGMHMHISKR